MNYGLVSEEFWIRRVRQGDFTAIPDPFTYGQSSRFSHLINGYRISIDMGWSELPVWANQRCVEAARTGQWRGTALELWCVLFHERRRNRHSGEGALFGREITLQNRLCATLRDKLQVMNADEHALIQHFIIEARRPLTCLH